MSSVMTKRNSVSSSESDIKLSKIAILNGEDHILAKRTSLRNALHDCGTESLSFKELQYLQKTHVWNKLVCARPSRHTNSPEAFHAVPASMHETPEFITHSPLSFDGSSSTKIGSVCIKNCEKKSPIGIKTALEKCQQIDTMDNSSTIIEKMAMK